MLRLECQGQFQSLFSPCCAPQRPPWRVISLSTTGPCSSPHLPAPIPASHPAYFWNNHSKFHQMALKELINGQGEKHFCSELQPGNASAFLAMTLISTPAPAPGSSFPLPSESKKHFLFRDWAMLKRVSSTTLPAAWSSLEMELITWHTLAFPIRQFLHLQLNC